MAVKEQPCYVEPYDHDVFHSLRSLTTAHRLLGEIGVSEHSQKQLRDLFKHHGTAKTVGLWVPHRHFSMSKNERLVEYGQVATPWLVRGTAVLGGRIVPKSWVFRRGSLYPVEFSFDPSRSSFSISRFPEVRLSNAFVAELHEILVQEGLQDILGLTSIENMELNLGAGKVANVERTIGRVSIMLPGTFRPPRAMEVSWSFGCSKALSDSRSFAAKICWVCDDCEDVEGDLGLLGEDI